MKKITVLSSLAMLLLLPAGLNHAAYAQMSTAMLPPSQSVVLKSGFDSRFAEIRAQISAAVASRQLNRAEAANLSTAVNQLAFEVDRDYRSGGGFSNDEVPFLFNKLNNIAQEVTSTIQSCARPVCAPNLAALGPINQRITVVQNRLITATRSGQLRPRQAEELRAMLDHTIRMRDRDAMHGMNGPEMAEINLTLENMNSQMENDIATNVAFPVRGRR